MPSPVPRAPRMIVLTLLTVLAAVAVKAPAAHAEGTRAIPWGEDLDRARREASASNRLVWVQFTGPYCPNCRRMDAEAFHNPAIVAHAGTGFLPVKLNTERYADLAVSYGFSSLPATLILGPSGEVVSRVQGYSDPPTFLAFLRDALSRTGRLAMPAAGVGGAGRGRLALGGFCPVSLVDGRTLAVGLSAFALERSGTVYRFATAEARDAFLASPERYLAVDGGRCPVAEVDGGESRPGSPHWGVVYDGHLYLCSSEAARARFLARPTRYAGVDGAIRRSCPHCWAYDAGIIRGSGTVSLRRPAPAVH